MIDFSIDNDNVLFVFGPARGGTTYLTTFLDDWFEYGMGPEGTFINQLYKQVDNYGDLTDDTNFNKLLVDISTSDMMTIMREVWPEEIQIDVSPKVIKKHVQERSFQGAAYAALAAIADLRGKKHVGSKDPSFWTCWRLLDRLFGEKAKYLCIVRDGRDVALSLFREKWGERSVYIAAKRWVDFLETVKEMQENIPSERLMVIKYETVLTEAEFTIDELEKITGVTLADDRKNDATNTIKNNPQANNFNKWKKKMSQQDIAIFDSVAGSWLDAYNYDCSESKYNVRLHEKAYYELEEFWRKVELTVRDITGTR